MKLVRYGAPGREKPGIIDADGKISDLSRVVPDIDGAMLAAGGLAKIRKANLKRLKTVAGKPRLGACIGHVRNYIAIGLNYADHAAESGVPVPSEPVVFNKAPSCICGPNDNTMIPKDSSKLDYECELGVVIGKRARYLAKEKAMDAVAGYCMANDVSERAFQMEHGQTICQGQGRRDLRPARALVRHQGRDQGPAEPRDVAQRQRREAPARQHQDHGVRCGAHRLVLLATLRARAGRRDRHRHAAGRRPRPKPEPVCLKAGDVVELGIDGLGTQKQKIVPFKA